MKALITAYTCEPGSGSEPGAGYALVRAGADVAECWVLTRQNQVGEMKRALDNDPPANEVHLVSVDGPDLLLRLKKRTAAIRSYYAYWQRLAAGQARALTERVDFDIAHHATMSAFWLPIGLFDVDLPLVLGPLSGGTSTPSSLRRYLGARGAVHDLLRSLATRVSAALRSQAFKEQGAVVLLQNRQMLEYAKRYLVSTHQIVRVHPHATAPTIELDWGQEVDRGADILFVGRLVPWKGGALAVESFAAAELEGQRLMIVGTGPDEKRLMRLARGFGIEDSVEFVGRLDRQDLLRRMRTAAALLFPSLHDSAGFVVSEALSLGVPVVCLDHGGPGTLTALWSSTPARAITPSSPEQTVRKLAEALREMIEVSPLVPSEPVLPDERLDDVIRWAYETAAT